MSKVFKLEFQVRVFGSNILGMSVSEWVLFVIVTYCEISSTGGVLILTGIACLDMIASCQSALTALQTTGFIVRKLDVHFRKRKLDVRIKQFCIETASICFVLCFCLFVVYIFNRFFSVCVFI